MSYSGLSLRLAGLTSAAAMLFAAAQLLLLSFEVDPVLNRSRLGTVVDWISDRPRPGPGILAGLALLVLAAWLVWSFVKSFGPRQRAIRIARHDADGSTRVDVSTLEAAIERHVDSIEPRGDVRVRLKRSGRIDAILTTPDISRTGPSQRLRDAIDEFCIDRSLPCRSGRITVSTPRRVRRRVQ
jgi:hypothetical protein